MSLSATIKSIQDIMRKDAGIDGDAQRLGQLGWMLFFKIYSDLELEAEIEDGSYVSPIPAGLHWKDWADQDLLGKSAPTGDELMELIESRLFPELKELDLDALSGRTRERGALLRSVFEDAFNYMKSGTLLRQVVNKLDSEIDFNSSKTRHLFGDIYEQVLSDLQSAGNSGEFYTPRAATHFAIEMLNPRLGETILDPACGTGGFLTHALAHVQEGVQTPEDLQIMQEGIHGVEKKALPHLLCVTNLMIHGIEVPKHIRHGNTLARPLRDYGKDDLVDLVATNPPFVGMEEDGIESNFPAVYRTRETAHLFMALTIELLRPSGRAAIVMPDSFLFAEGVAQNLRERLVNDCNLHTIVRLPNGVFAPYTDIRTNILFFDRSGPTQQIWYHEVQPPVSGGKFTKTQKITDADFDQAREWWNDRASDDRSWVVPREEFLQRPYLNLDIENPVKKDPAVEFSDRMLKLESDEADAAIRWGEIEAAVDQLELSESPIHGLFADLELLKGRVQLTSGYLEELRLSITEMVLRGALSSGPSTQSGHQIVEEMSLRSPDQLPPSYGPPFEIPDHWAWAQIGQLFDFTIGKTPPTKEPRYWTSPEDAGSNPFISISDMPRRGEVDSVERAVTRAAIEEDLKREPIAPGTLLMAFKLSVGKTAISQLDNAYFNEAIAAIEVRDDGLQKFLLWALPVMATYGAKNPAVRGATLNKKAIQALWIPVPPADEQQRIASALQTLTELLEGFATSHEQARSSASEAFKLLREKSRTTTLGTR